MEETMSSDSPADLRLVLLGSQRFGVASVANRILGGAEEIQWGMCNTHSLSRTVEVEGRKVQLVKAPVWFRGYHLQDTAELVRQELVLSLAHTRPGPHAFILLCEVDLPFTSACARAVDAHLSLLGPHVWAHTLLLFTCGDWLGHSSLEDYLEGEGFHLAQLLDRCGHRYLLDSTSAPDLSRRLMTKVQELLSANGGQHFHIDEDRIQRIVQSREEVNRRAEQRRMRRKEGTKTKPDSLMSKITIMLLGWVFANKTSVYGALCPSLLPEVDGRTDKCVSSSRRVTVGSSSVSLTVVDIPGWWKFFDASLVPSGVRAEINKAFDKAKAAQQTPYSRTAFLLMLPADTSFTQEQLGILTQNLQPLGDTVWEQTILVFTGGHWVQNFDVELHIEAEGEALVWLVERCGNRYFVFDTEANKSGLKTQGKKLIQMVWDLCQSKPMKGRTTRGKHQVLTKDCPEVFTDDPPQVLTKDPALAKDQTSVDEDLRKMVEVLHQVWGWSQWEIQKIKSRLDLRPILQVRDNRSVFTPTEIDAQSKRMEDGPVMEAKESSMDEAINLSRTKVENIVRVETRGKTLEELLKILSEIYFRKECGAFDIVSIICENEQFRPEWRSLFEREWSRRESRLLEYTFTKHFKFHTLDEIQKQRKIAKKVEAWLERSYSSDWIEHIEDQSIKEPVKNIIYKLKRGDQCLPVAAKTPKSTAFSGLCNLL